MRQMLFPQEKNNSNYIDATAFATPGQYLLLANLFSEIAASEQPCHSDQERESHVLALNGVSFERNADILQSEKRKILKNPEYNKITDIACNLHLFFHANDTTKTERYHRTNRKKPVPSAQNVTNGAALAAVAFLENVHASILIARAFNENVPAEEKECLDIANKRINNTFGVRGNRNPSFDIFTYKSDNYREARKDGENAALRSARNRVNNFKDFQQKPDIDTSPPSSEVSATSDGFFTAYTTASVASSQGAPVIARPPQTGATQRAGGHSSSGSPRASSVHVLPGNSLTPPAGAYGEITRAARQPNGANSAELQTPDIAGSWQQYHTENPHQSSLRGRSPRSNADTQSLGLRSHTGSSPENSRRGGSPGSTDFIGRFVPASSAAALPPAHQSAGRRSRHPLAPHPGYGRSPGRG